MKLYIRYIIFIFFVLFCFNTAFCLSPKQFLNDGKYQHLPTIRARLGNSEFDFMIARTELEKAKGLMFRRFMPENQGMIFVYNNEQIMSFWMKNTIIPLDLVFISSELKITEWILNMKPGYGALESELEHYVSEKQARYAIELNAGVVEKIGLKVGDKLEVSPMFLYNN